MKGKSKFLGLLLLSSGLILNHTVGESSMVGYLLVGASLPVLLLELLSQKIDMTRVKALKKRLFGIR